MGESFRYGELKVTVESLQTIGQYEEHGVTIEAPGHFYAFRRWHSVGASLRLVSQVVVYDLIYAYEEPLKFLKQHSSPSYLTAQMRSPEGDRSFVSAAGELGNFLQQAHLDVYKDWSLKPLPAHFQTVARGPFEWFP